MHSPLYTLKIVPTDRGTDTRIVNGNACNYTPAFSICPLELSGMPAGYEEIARIDTQNITVRSDYSAKGTVTTPDGRSSYFKPREEAREKDFNRELNVIAKIKQLHLINGEVKLPELQTIAVSGSAESESCVGILMILIPTSPTGGSLLNS